MGIGDRGRILALGALGVATPVGARVGGRVMVGRTEARLCVTRNPPVVASHTGVRGTADNARNLSDAHVRGIAETGGVLGIGFWPTACGGEDVASIARSIRYAVGVAGIEHVGLGSDLDGAVPVPFDATGLVQLTDALLEAGLDDDEIAKVMGGNARRVLADNLPD